MVVVVASAVSVSQSCVGLKRGEVLIKRIFRLVYALCTVRKVLELLKFSFCILPVNFIVYMYVNIFRI